MKYLNNNATHINTDLENGFVFATDFFDKENYFQACLELKKDGNGYKKEINSGDSGWDDGLCGDYNKSIGVATEEHYAEFLKLARKCGIKVL
jgi:hypothetical protein